MIQNHSIAVIAAVAILVTPSQQAQQLNTNRHLAVSTETVVDSYKTLTSESVKQSSEFFDFQALYDGAVEYLYGTQVSKSQQHRLKETGAAQEYAQKIRKGNKGPFTVSLFPGRKEQVNSVIDTSTRWTIFDDSVALFSDSAIDHWKYQFVEYRDTQIFGREVEDFVCFDRLNCDNRMRYLRSTSLIYEGVLGLAKPDTDTIFRDPEDFDIYSSENSNETLDSILDRIDTQSFSTRFSSGSADSWLDL